MATPHQQKNLNLNLNPVAAQAQQVLSGSNIQGWRRWLAAFIQGLRALLSRIFLRHGGALDPEEGGKDPLQDALGAKDLTSSDAEEGPPQDVSLSGIVPTSQEAALLAESQRAADWALKSLSSMVEERSLLEHAPDAAIDYSQLFLHQTKAALARIQAEANSATDEAKTLITPIAQTLSISPGVLIDLMKTGRTPLNQPSTPRIAELVQKLAELEQEKTTAMDALQIFLYDASRHADKRIQGLASMYAQQMGIDIPVSDPAKEKTRASTAPQAKAPAEQPGVKNAQKAPLQATSTPFTPLRAPKTARTNAPQQPSTAPQPTNTVRQSTASLGTSGDHHDLDEPPECLDDGSADSAPPRQ